MTNDQDHDHDHGEAFPRQAIASLVAGKQPPAPRGWLPALLIALAASLFALALPSEGVDGEVVRYVSRLLEPTALSGGAWDLLSARLMIGVTGLAAEPAAFLLAALAFGAACLPLARAGVHFGLGRGANWLAVAIVATSVSAWLAGTRPHLSALGLLVAALLLATLSSPHGKGAWTSVLVGSLFLVGSSIYAPFFLLLPAIGIAMLRRKGEGRSRLWIVLVFVLASLIPVQQQLAAGPALRSAPYLQSFPELFGLSDIWLFAAGPGVIVFLWAALLAQRGSELESSTPAWLLAWLAAPLIAFVVGGNIDLDAWTLLLPLAIPGAAALQVRFGERRAAVLLTLGLVLQGGLLIGIVVRGRVASPAWQTAVEANLRDGDAVISHDARRLHLFTHRYGLSNRHTSSADLGDWLTRMEQAGRRVLWDRSGGVLPAGETEQLEAWLSAGRLELLPTL